MSPEQKRRRREVPPAAVRHVGRVPASPSRRCGRPCAAIAVAFAIGAHGLAFGARAQEPSDLTPGLQLDEVVVTATKIERPARFITDSVTIVDEEEIERQGFTDTTEILRQTAGIQFTQAGGPGQFNYPKLRGFSSGHFLVVIDGVKVNESLNPGVGHLLGQIDPSLIERIEVLRGPQADLYGSDSTAGVIAITTKAPLPGTNFQMLGEVGSLDWKKAYGSARGTWNDFGYSLNTVFVDSEGVHEHEAYRNTSPQLKLTYSPGDWLSLVGSFLYTDAKFNYAELLESYEQDSPETPWWAFQLPDPDQFNKSERYLASFKVAHELTENLRQRLLFGWARQTNANRDDDDGLLGYIPAPRDPFSLDFFTFYSLGQAVPVYDTGDGRPYHYRDENLQLDYNLVLDTPLSGGLNTALIGYEWFSQEGRSWGRLGELEGKVDNHAFYLNDVLVLLEGDLVLNGGLRYQDHETFGHKTTGKIGAAYRFPSATTLFANYGTSFRAPSFIQLFDAQYGNPGLGPENGWTFEAGLRQSALDDRLEAELIYWRTRLDDVIAFIGSVDPETFQFTGTFENRDRGETEGVELIVDWWVTEGWRLSANYTYTDSWTEQGGERFRAVQVARNTGNLGVAYVRDRWSAGANLYYTGPRLRWNGDIEMDAYTRVDLFGRYALSEGVSVFGRIENLFDESIEEGKGFEQPGFYLTAGIDYRFGP
jgi:outer membrane cobalamin receptor